MVEADAPATGARVRFVAAICAGSFLLFLVQPMVARMALPRLGGAPSVWNSAMLVYQALLLAGYGYAHAIGRLAPRTQATLHAALFLLAALALPIGLIGATPPEGISPALWVLWLIGGSIGPLFFVVAAQAPLLQRWFALTSSRDPYPLYAASNLGSFLGLITYPLLIEPFMPLHAQSLLWSAGYALLFFLVAWCAIALPGSGVTPAAVEKGERLSTGRMLHWLILSAVPSGLLLSTTLHLTTDIVAMPLLWVLPLGLYLLSFSVAFSANRRWTELLSTLAPLFLLIGAATAFIDATAFPLIVAIMILSVLFTVAVALHGQLYDLRPEPGRLTLFYLIMSAGGMLGGLFCALVAPLVFDWTYEHPLLLIGAALLLVRSPLFGWSEELFEGRRGVVLTLLLAITGLLLSLLGEGLLVPTLKSGGLKGACFLVLVALCVVTVGRRLPFAIALCCLMLCLGGWLRLQMTTTPGALMRSYFGIYMVRERDDGFRLLVHGTTIHGMQNLKPGHETEPTSYYAPQSGVGLALAAAPADARIGVVGLGTGTLACYARPGQTWRFYEIDPVMVGIARDPGAFTFLSRCLPQADIVVGDARLTLAKERPGSMDVLVIDAFSSDAIPMHLLTREAIASYARLLSPRGVLMIHISNRFLDLKPVLAAAAREEGLTARLRHYKPTPQDAKDHAHGASVWVALARDPAQLTRIAAGRPGDWQAIPPRPGFRAWTDDHGSILPLLKR